MAFGFVFTLREEEKREEQDGDSGGGKKRKRKYLSQFVTYVCEL